MLATPYPVLCTLHSASHILYLACTLHTVPCALYSAPRTHTLYSVPFTLCSSLLQLCTSWFYLPQGVYPGHVISPLCRPAWAGAVGKRALPLNHSHIKGKLQSSLADVTLQSQPCPTALLASATCLVTSFPLAEGTHGAVPGLLKASQLLGVACRAAVKMRHASSWPLSLSPCLQVVAMGEEELRWGTGRPRAGFGRHRITVNPD
jgi:hypothetical protein